jgi:hypothetical protein
MPRPKTSGRDRETSDRKTCGRKPRKAAAGATAEGDAAASPLAASAQAPLPSDAAPAEITVESLIRDLGEVLKIAVNRGRPTAAVAAAVAIARLLQALPDKPGRPPSRHKPGSSPAPPAKFDGNYHDAARRVAFLLGIGKEQTAEAPEAPEAPDEANGQKRDRHS